MLQEKAVAAGGFSAPAASLCLEELGVGTPAGWLHRGLLLQVRTSTLQSSRCCNLAVSHCITALTRNAGAISWWALPLWSWRTCPHVTYTPN
jgi:hypothetical protein